MEELKTHDSKRKEVLKESEELVNSLNTQLEEIKESEEDLKIQLTRKENSYHMLELEIINFKKINESTNADLMTQIEEAKKNEESQKIQFTKKE
jgi:hypothetical protein